MMNPGMNNIIPFDKIIIALQADNKKSNRLVEYLLKDNIYKLFNDENIKFVLKVFDRDSKSFFLDYKIYSSPFLYCCLNDNTVDEVRLDNYKDIFNWIKRLKLTIEKDKILSNNNNHNMSMIGAINGNQNMQLNTVKNMNKSAGNTIQKTFLDDSATNFMEEELIKNYKGDGKFEKDEEDTEDDIKTKIEDERNREQEKRNRIKGNDPRVVRNTNEIKTMQEFEKQYNPNNDIDTDQYLMSL